MGTPSDKKLINENGLRLDGRGDEELRPIKISTDILERADGSAFMEWVEIRYW